MKKNYLLSSMIFFDGHVHLIWNGSFESASLKWQPIIEQGLRGIGGIIIPYYPREAEKFLKLVPAQYHKKMVDSYFFKEVPEFQITHVQAINNNGFHVFPYLDIRFLESQTPDLDEFRQQGFKGLKILYIPEEDHEFEVLGWNKFFGRSVKDSEKFTICLVEQAFNFGWPIIFHLDLRKYEGFIREILEATQGHPVIIPHFGFSRKIMADLIERFDSCYTDISSLLPFMENNPQSYFDFITAYQDRILFGSDTLWDEPNLTTDYLKFIINFVSDEQILTKILSKNYIRIHGE